MVQIEIHGRLGNQMFQYASIKGIMRKYEYTELGMNFQNEVYRRNFENNLVDFNIDKYEEIKKINLNVYQKFLLTMVKVLQKILEKICKTREKFLIKQNYFERKLAPFLSKNGIYLLQQGYVEFRKTKFKNQICIGCFESPKYFNHIKKEILEEFTPKVEMLKENDALYEHIKKEESVCISIRRGDFLSDKNKKAHYVCTPEYFKKAVELMKSKIDNPTFIIFSDDIGWVKENMKFEGKVLYESGKDPVWEKLRLMYSCKHFIISNSTFSWWAQYLSRNEKKIVIAPSRWKNTYQNKDIYEENWDLIEVS